MNPDFQRMMSRAALQTRGGDLLEATRSIQQALAGSTDADACTAMRSQDDAVIDVETRVVDEHPHEIGSGEIPVNEAERFLAATHARGRVSINYRLYVPPGDPAQPRPLLLMLHGCTQDPDDFAAGTRMNEVAKRHGWLVLYPEQSTRLNPQACWNWFKPNHQARGRGEPALLAALTHHVMAEHRVDARRVHVAGLSAGGAMAAVLGQAYPELFASVGVHSGLPCGAVSNAPEAMAMMRSGPATRTAARAGVTRSPIPTIVFHGTRDMTVHPLNGELVYADATAGVEVTERVEHGREGGRAYSRKTSIDTHGRTLAELWLIDGAGHAWSGGDQRGSHADWQGPDAASQMICFFSAHPRSGDN